MEDRTDFDAALGSADVRDGPENDRSRSREHETGGADPGAVDRRAYLGAIGAVAVGTTAGLAGCLGGSEPDTGEPFLDNEPDYKGWFDGVSNYRGTRDRRGQSETTVEVGVTANGGALGFGPSAIAVSPGTTVTWDWTGRGGDHNVVSESSVFDSGDPVRDDATTFEHAFDSPGVFRYVCAPHRTVGMRGAVFVALEG